VSYLEPDASDLEAAKAVVEVVRAGGDDWWAVLRHFGNNEMEANDAINHAEAQGWVTLRRSPTGEMGSFVLHDPPSRVAPEDAAKRVLSRLEHGTRKNKKRLAGETALPGGVVRQALDLLAERGQAEQVGTGPSRPWLRTRPGGSEVVVTRKASVPVQATPTPAPDARGEGDGETPKSPAAEETSQTPDDAASGKAARAQDPALRAAMERRSLDVAWDYYVNELGATDYVEVGKPYDIRVTVNGVVRHCEVKGSSARIDTVELTIKEVEHGTTFEPMDLIVVDGIEPVRDPATGEVMGGTGGRRRVWTDWKPELENLKPLTFAYRLTD
jgi:hypothetical protein